jgi:fatty-acyl-CoA synthase
MDDDGYVYLLGRSKDMLVSGGFNVYPREIERVLEEHPLVSEAAVVAAAHERWGEVPVAYVVASGDASAGDLPATLAGFLTGRLAKYKLPKHYEVIAELPRNANGKVLKRELRERRPAV